MMSDDAADGTTMTEPISTGENTADAGQAADLDIRALIAESVKDAMGSAMGSLKDDLFAMTRKISQKSVPDTRGQAPATTERPSTAAATTEPDIAALRDELSSLRREQSIRDKLATRPDIAPRDRDMIQRLALAERPADLDAWWSANVPTSTNPNPTRGVAPQTRANGEIDNASLISGTWSKDDFARHFEQHAKNPAAPPGHPDNREYYRSMRQRLEAALQRVSVRIRE